MNQTNATVTTRPAAGATAIETAVTFNWDGMEQADLIALAQQALVVKLQGGWRKNGIPATATVNVTEHKVGARAPRSPKDLASMIAALSPADKAALLASLAG